MMISTLNKILVALLLASTIGKVHGYAHASQRKNSADADAQIGYPRYIVINQVNAQKGQLETADEKEKENREERRKDVELYLTVSIAGAGLIQGLFACLQWRIYGQQLKTSMPLVIIDWGNFIHISPPDPDPISGPKAMIHHFNWGIRNVGPTPAFIIDTSARFVIVPTSQGIPKMDYAEPKPYIGEPLFTEPKPVEGGMPFYAKIMDDRSYEQIEAAYRSGNETLYAFGCIRFRDRYGKKHISRFCLRYYAWKEMRRDYDGFGIAGKKQNQYK